MAARQIHRRSEAVRPAVPDGTVGPFGMVEIVKACVVLLLTERRVQPVVLALRRLLD